MQYLDMSDMAISGDDTNLDLFHHNGSVMKMEHEHRMSVDDGGSADGQSCDICGDVSDGLHFGVFTCRGWCVHTLNGHCVYSPRSVRTRIFRGAYFSEKNLLRRFTII